MGNDQNNMGQNNQGQTRQPQQQPGGGAQQNPSQQNQQKGGQGSQGGQSGQSGQRIDTDGDGRTRDPNDTRPTDQGGQGSPVQR